MTHRCVSKLAIFGSDYGFNEIQWNIDKNPYIFIQEKAFENAVCEMSTRRRAIIWTNDGKITDAYMRRSASMS